MKRLISLLFGLFIISCQHQALRPIEKWMSSDKGIILSCLRCSCMIKVLEDYTKGHGFNNIPIYLDSACIGESPLREGIQISQEMIDSLYKENYNILLFRRASSGMEFRVVETIEFSNFERIAKRFFE